MTLEKQQGQASETVRIPNPPTICRCGLARSYHPGLADHEYVPRYDPVAWREGYRQALTDSALRVTKIDPDTVFQVLVDIEWRDYHSTRGLAIALAERLSHDSR